MFIPGFLGRGEPLIKSRTKRLRENATGPNSHRPSVTPLFRPLLTGFFVPSFPRHFSFSLYFFLSFFKGDYCSASGRFLDALGRHWLWFRVYLVLLVCLLGSRIILLGFTGLYWALLGFTGFYWVLLGNLGFTGINSTCILLDCFFCLDLHILLAYTGFYWVLLSSIGITGIYSKCTLLYCFFLDLRILLGFAGIY